MGYMRLFLLVCVGFFVPSHLIYGDLDVRKTIIKTLDATKSREFSGAQLYNQTYTYYLKISDFYYSLIEIPTSTYLSPGISTTISSTYLAGRAPIYDQNNNKVGVCTASFLCIRNEDQSIYTDISNFISVDNGLIVTWFTPTTLANLDVDTIINSMVTECIVTATTKVGVNPFYGQTFDLVVSSENGNIYFQFTRTGTIF